MTFISLQFLLVFLPAAVLLLFLLGRLDAPKVTGVAIAAISLLFYAGFGWVSLGILVGSVLTNYWVARLISGLKRRTLALIFGIVVNLIALGAFKYFSGLVLVRDGVAFVAVVGISYFTFQQITYLLQVHSRRLELLSFVDYLQFVLFLPTLISGPIPRADELRDGYRSARRITLLGLQVGLTMICIGIAKKVLLADPLTPVIDAVFSGGPDATGRIAAWIGALAFTLQVYFDFSGYTDIAIGCARIFGITLPINFLSPLRATSIQDFWRRWHMTMTRFFSDFVYAPLAVTATRRAMAGRASETATFVLSVALPTIATFVLVGFWHDAGVNFLLFGLLHGLALTAYQWRAQTRRTRWPRLVGWATTFLFLVVTLVLFRAPDFATALRVWSSMIGLHPEGVTLVAVPVGLGYVTVLVGALAAALALPSTYEFMSAHEPGLKGSVPVASTPTSRLIRWHPNKRWAALLGFVAGLCLIIAVRGELTNFVYVRF